MPSFQEQFCSSNYSPKIPSSFKEASQFCDALYEVLNIKKDEHSQETLNFSLSSTLASLFQDFSHIVELRSNLYCGILGSTGSGKSYACDKTKDLIGYLSEDKDITSIVPKTAMGFLSQIHRLHPLKSFSIFFEEMIKHKISERNYESFFNIALSLFECKEIQTHASLNATKNHDLPNSFENINVSLIWNSTIKDVQSSFSEGAFQDDFFGRNLIFIIPYEQRKFKSKPRGLFQIEYLSRVKKRFYELKKIDSSLLANNLYEIEALNFFNLIDNFTDSLMQARKKEDKEYSEFSRLETIIKRLFNNIVFFESLMSSEVITINEIVTKVEAITNDKGKVSDLFNYCKTLAFRSIHNIKDNSPYFSDLEGIDRYPKKVIEKCIKIQKKYDEYLDRRNEAHALYIRSRYREEKDFNKIYYEAMHKPYKEEDDLKKLSNQGEEEIRDDYIAHGWVSRSYLFGIVKDKRMLDSCIDYFKDNLGDDYWEKEVPMPTNQGRSIKLYRFDFDGRWRVNIQSKSYLYEEDVIGNADCVFDDEDGDDE